MSTCKDCSKSFASRQSLSNHRKRAHPDTVQDNIVKNVSLPKTLKSKAQEKKEVRDVLDAILSREPSKDVRDTSLSPPDKIAKVSTDKIVSTDDESDSDPEDSNTEESESENIEVPEDTKKQDSMLIDVFTKLYSHFDEDDVEMCNDILRLLDVLKARRCVTEREYVRIKSLLAQQMQLSLHESVNSTVENMTRDDKNEVLGLLRSMKKDKEAKKLMALVKAYFEEEMELENALLLLPRLKDKLNAQRVKIILKNIEKTRNRVSKIFTRLTNGTDKGENLNDLRASNHITDEQYDKLSIGPHTLPSISRIIQGKGLYLRRK